MRGTRDVVETCHPHLTDPLYPDTIPPPAQVRSCCEAALAASTFGISECAWQEAFSDSARNRARHEWIAANYKAYR
jgi:hypothetical protein